MNILIISHTRKNTNTLRAGRWRLLPDEFSKRGHKVTHIFREDWFSIFSIIRKIDPALIIATGPVAGIIALLRKVHLIRIPLIFDWNDNYHEIMGAKWGFIIKILENTAARWSDFVVSCSLYRMDKSKTHFSRVELKNLFYIPNGIRDDHLNSQNLSELPGKLKLKVVYIGRLSSVKRIPQLLNSWSSVNADLILVGPGDVPNHGENVHVLGRVDPSKVPSFLFASDALLITEDNDSSLKIQEYLSIGKPILAPKGRISKAFNQSNFLFYNSFDEIKSLIQNLPKVKSLAVPSWTDLARQYEEVLNKI